MLADDVLSLRRRCNCGLFGQMVHVALPELKHPMARSKKVHDMFQLANVASISEQECWGDERKEEELRKKQSSYLTPYGLALAMNAHRRRCHEYAEAVQNAKGSGSTTHQRSRKECSMTPEHTSPPPSQCWTSWGDLDSTLRTTRRCSSPFRKRSAE